MPKVHDGRAIRRAYEALGLTRRQFAQLVGLNPRSITNITGAVGICSRAAAARIAEVLGWDISKVIEDEQAPAEARSA